MPTYEYSCNACDHAFEEFQLMSEAPLKKCPKCGKLKLRRHFGIGAAVIFKGSGFYETDYRGESYKKAAKAEQEAEKSSKGNQASTTSTKGSTGGGEGDQSGSSPAKKSSKSKAKASDD